MSKADCGNGILEDGEACDGSEFSDDFKRKFPENYYSHSCSATCNPSASSKTTNTIRVKRIISYYDLNKCPSPVPNPVYCGDGVKQTKAYKESL
jgi:hypothetical protein